MADADETDVAAFARLHESPDAPQPSVLSALAQKIARRLAAEPPAA